MAIFAPFLLICLLGSSLSVAEPRCGGVLTNRSGVITSPNYPSNYPNNITCTWKIYAEKSHLNLTIEDFMLEDSSSCEVFDFVKIQAKGWRSRGQLTLCGSIASRQISLHVEGTAVEITFKSDFSFSARGFKISYRAYDVDPCLKNNGDCSHFCNLKKGKRVCSCPAGFKLTWSNGLFCKGISSCYFVGHTKCPRYNTCKDLPGGTTTCVCWRGYRKQNGTCQDIDECKENPGRCGVGTCRNYRGWFSCSCPKGYRFNGSTCSDIDECKHYNPPDCGDATCINTIGSHVCQCARGYQFNTTLLACQDIDECTTSSHGCKHVCTNTNGSYICSCRAGYFLTDSKTCRAVRVEGLGSVENPVTCQGESLNITCKINQQALIIYQALFVRGGSGVCPYKYKQGLPEHDTDDSSQEEKCMDDVTVKIKDMCGWRKRCTVTVNSETLGEVCTGNYLKIQYSCGKPLMCKPPKLSCPAVEEDECTSDESCHSSQMCCFDGCKRACTRPSLYSRET